MLLFPHLVTVTGIKFDSKYGGKSVYGSVGSSVTFTWSFSGGVGRVDWGLKKTGFIDIIKLVSLDNTGVALPINTPVPDAYSQRVSGKFIGDASSGQASFTLFNLTQSDERFFGCKIRSAGFPLTLFDDVQLLVQEPPIITDPTSANVNYNEGTPINISCKATGKPDPDVMWIHNGQVKSSGSKAAHLTFVKISKDDTGMYTCRANSSGGVTEKQVNIVINYAAFITNATSLATESWIGQTVKLTCEADGVPTPVLTWKKTRWNWFKKSYSHRERSGCNDERR